MAWRVSLCCLAVVFQLGPASAEVPAHELADAPIVLNVAEHAIIPYPRTAEQILKNIKFALENDILLNENFYTDENLKNFSGGTKIVWPWRTADKKSALISGFDQIVAPIHSGTISMPGLDYGIARWVEANGSIKVTISVIIKRPEIMFEQIESLFGKQWKSYPYIPSPHQRLDTPTHPKGNDWIEYDFTHNHRIETAVFGFAADGSLYKASIGEELQQ